jgi:hypothetical protein
VFENHARISRMVSDSAAGGAQSGPRAFDDHGWPIPEHVGADPIGRTRRPACDRAATPRPSRQDVCVSPAVIRRPRPARAMARRSWTTSRTPRRRSRSVSMSAALTSVACINASMRMTASVSPYRRPRSNAVRAGVVTAMPRAEVTSSSASASQCKTMPGVLCWPAWFSSVGRRGSIHSGPVSVGGSWRCRRCGTRADSGSPAATGWRRLRQRRPCRRRVPCDTTPVAATPFPPKPRLCTVIRRFVVQIFRLGGPGRSSRECGHAPKRRPWRRGRAAPR